MNSRSARLALSLTIAMFAVPGISVADDTSAAKAAGERLAYTCHGCHGIENYKNAFPVYTVPKLGGQRVAYLVVALKAYASQERPHATMHAQSASLSEQDMQAIATFLSGEEIRSAGHAVGTAPKAAQTCLACHGNHGINDGIGLLPEYPNLTGQHPDYIEHTLKAYRSGQRKNAVMAGMSAGLTDADIEALATYYGRQQPSLCATDETREHGRCPAR
jgi:cytochrome c553